MHDVIGLLVDVLFHQRHLCRDVECSLLAEGDFVAQDVVGHRIVRQQKLVQVLLVAGADIQFATQ
ncbi:hypothetical protein D3C81_1682960 [compost metagenome]